MSILFTGDYANPTEPLWLRVFSPGPPPANLQVSTITMNASGGQVMLSGGQAYPNTTGAPIAFNRSDNASLSATELRQTPSKNVPSKSSETTYLASVDQGGASYDDIALAGLQIYGNQATLPAANSGAAGYLTAGSNSGTVQLLTNEFITGAVSSLITRANIGNFQTLNVNNGFFSTITLSTSSGLINNNLQVSSINAQTGNISTFTSLTVSAPVINAQTLTASTINVSTFALPNALTISSINASSINTGIISSLVGNFSTLNAPGGTTTPVVSTVVAIAKEIFTSTMVFTTTVSPQIDLGLGGIVGGLVGGVAANAMGVGLGAAGLATGASALILSRTSGGLNPGQFQTVNGTTQLQFSTIKGASGGTPLYGKFATTNSADPLHTPGALSTSTNFLGYGQSYVVRSVSDPLNLPNTAGAAGAAIQSFGEWVKVMPGPMDMGISSIINTYNTNYVDFGNTAYAPGNPIITIGNKAFDNSTGLPPTVFVNGALSLNFNGGIAPLQAGTITGTDSMYTPLFGVSTILPSNGTGGYYGSTIGIYPGVITSTLQVSTLTAGNVAISNTSFTNLSVSNVLTVGNNINATNNITTSNVNLQKINGIPYAPSGQPIGSLMMWPGGDTSLGPINVPSGYLYCDGATYSVGAPYAALYAAIGNTWGGVSGVNFRVPNTVGRVPFGSLTDSAGSSPYQYTATVTFTTTTATGPGIPGGETGNAWYVIGTTQQVYIGMNYTFGAGVGTRTIVKICGDTNGVGDGWTVPFLIIWSSLVTPTTFPVFAPNSQANLYTNNKVTIAPYIGKQPDNVVTPTIANLRSMGTPGISQAVDQTSAHKHTYNLGDGKAYNVAGAPDYISNNNAKDTSTPQGGYVFTIPGGAATATTNTMVNLPPNFGIYYYIKYQ